MITLENCRIYENSTTLTTTPSWYKAERYQYCEPLDENKKKDRVSLITILVSMLIG